MQDTKSLVIQYFQSWQEPADFELLAECVSEDVHFDAGFFNSQGRDAFVGFCAQNPTPWRDVHLLHAVYNDNQAAILYSGINTATGKRMQVSEHLTLESGKICDIKTTIAEVA